MSGAWRAGRAWLLGLAAALTGCIGPLLDALEEDAPALDGGLNEAGLADGGRADAASAGDSGAALPPLRDGGAAPDPAATASAILPAGAPLSACPAPPVGASREATSAWTLVNLSRLAAGAGCMNLVTALNRSALAHCGYYAANREQPSCIADAHTEVPGCAGFTGADVTTREIAAGYPSALAYTEVMTFYGSAPESAVPAWIGSVWHRIPLLDPWATDMGYGGAEGCDTIDIGRGPRVAPADTVVVYPYAGQRDVPLSFDGALEVPLPPAPAGGWPSSYPVSIYAQRLEVTGYALSKDGGAALAVFWLDARSAAAPAALRSYLENTAFLYGAPFEGNTRYRVRIVGRYAGGALDVSWTFTTRAAP